ncbi:hypothetical protein K7X08_031680 [Anisodus acutangulus]|uniref:Uncharacterized protein n=1 Tax=Anisodus acutangulus TaxID=402998 RepID=A0A9Q1MQ49_9SOLA|nr:hypothetical protein K7X08_031680 [Anisodus acutangulus]
MRATSDKGEDLHQVSVRVLLLFLSPVKKNPRSLQEGCLFPPSQSSAHLLDHLALELPFLRLEQRDLLVTKENRIHHFQMFQSLQLERNMTLYPQLPIDYHRLSFLNLLLSIQFPLAFSNLLWRPALRQYFLPHDFTTCLFNLQVSETCSHVPKDGSRSSDVDKPSKIGSTPRTRNSVNKIAAIAKSTSPKTGGRTTREKLQKPIKPELTKDKVKRQGKRSAKGEVPANACSSDKVVQEDKENLDTAQTEVIST